ncbi:MAG TPA: TetR/AcrR family transcriptional regulator [Candidatus Caenarcaniphilales bacterium]
MAAIRSAKSKRSSNAPQGRDPELTRSQILDAAEEEFANQGFKAARTEAIAARSGVTKAMIYYYFDSKEGLYRAILKRCATTLLPVIEEMNLEQLPPEEALEHFVYQLLRHTSSNPNLPPIMFLEAIQNKGRYYADTANLFSRIVAILERGIAAGSFRPLDPRHTAVNILGTCVFYFGALENIKHLWKGDAMLSKEMLEQHSQEALSFILAGVRF